MAHKKLTTPSSGASDKIYGTDWNTLIDSLQEQSAANPLTLNVDHHTLKHSATNAAGDLLKGAGTRFSRFPRGTANQLLRTNAAGTDLEWATISTGGDITGSANVGTGEGSVFRDEVTGVLNLKTLKQGSNVTITNNTNDVTIASSGGIRPGMATFEIYKDPTSGNYTSLNQDGTIFDGPDATPDAVFQNTINALANDYDTIYVHNGTYIFSAGFTGLTWTRQYTTIHLATRATLRAPNGFTGVTLKIEPTAGTGNVGFANHMSLIGGQFTEGGSAQRLWTAIQLHVPSAGTQDGCGEVQIRNTWIRNPGTGIDLKIDRTDGWINGCTFDGISIRTWGTTGINFDMSLTPSSIGDSKGFNRNIFSNCVLQCDPAVATQTGIKNVKHQRNVFVNCQVWDMPDGQNEIDITADADLTLIVGGRTNHKTWRNLSPSTIILDNDEIIRSPFSKESRSWGEIDTSETAGGLGLLKTLTVTGSPTVSVGASITGRRFATGTTINTTIGFRTSGNAFRSTHFPALKALIQFLESTQTRIFIGFTTLGAFVTADTSLGSTYSFGFMWRASDTNWQFVHNNNQASATFTDTGVAKAAAITSFKMYFLSATKLRYRINKTEVEGADKWRGTTISDVSGQNLSFQIGWTNTEALDKRITIADCKVYDGVIY